MDFDQKIVKKIDKVDFGVHISQNKEFRDPIKKNIIKKDSSFYLKIIYQLKSFFKTSIIFSRNLATYISKIKKIASRSIFLGRGMYFKYISNIALLIIVVFGAFVYLSFDNRTNQNVLSKYSGITSANSGGFVSTGLQSFNIERRATITQHTVNPGDTVSTIAARYSTPDNIITVDTILWANGLSSGDILRPGMVLDIPPVSGVVHTVKKGDTVESLAKQYKLLNNNSTPEEITGANQQIIDMNLLSVRVDQAPNGEEVRVPEIVEGQRIIIPGGIIEAPRPVATPRPVSRPPSAPVFTQPVQTPGATFAWPVAGGRGVISQRYHGGHRALDIADSARPPVVAMSNGTVIFAGRNDNTCGDQVNIAYDNGFTSIYCHLGSIDPSILSSYRSGARPRVVTGQVVGNMGATGYVTGIHLHMAILYQSVLVNPCAYDSIRARC